MVVILSCHREMVRDTMLNRLWEPSTLAVFVVRDPFRALKVINDSLIAEYRIGTDLGHQSDV